MQYWGKEGKMEKKYQSPRQKRVKQEDEPGNISKQQRTVVIMSFLVAKSISKINYQAHWQYSKEKTYIYIYITLDKCLFGGRLGVGGCSVHCRMFSSIPGLYLLNASSTPPLVVTTKNASRLTQHCKLTVLQLTKKNVSKHCQMLPSRESLPYPCYLKNKLYIPLSHPSLSPHTSHPKYNGGRGAG